MANIYVRSTDGLDTDTGATWALAKATATGAAAIDAAGDTIFLSNVHSETTAAAVTLAFAGTLASPTKLICGSDVAEPPTAVATTAVINTTGASGIDIKGNTYVYGVDFQCGTGLNSPILYCGLAGETQRFEKCIFQIISTGSARIKIGQDLGASPNRVVWQNCDVKFASGNNAFHAAGGVFEWRGGAILAGSASPANLFQVSNGRGIKVTLDGVDLSNLASTVNLAVPGTGGGMNLYTFRNCKLPASWTGSVLNGSPTIGSVRAEMHNCDSGDTNYRIWVKDTTGEIKEETTLVRTGGASDGVTALAWKMATTANATYPLVGLDSPELPAKWNTALTVITAAVEILHFAQGSGTNGALTDGEVGLKVMYSGDTATPLSSFVNDFKANVLADAAAQATSTVAWDSLVAASSAATDYAVGDVVKPSTANGAIYQCTTDAGTTAAEPTWGTTDGLTTSDAAGRVWTRCNRQKLVTPAFTPGNVGFIQGSVDFTLASKIIYVDPKFTVA